jgi:hypothetical protein
MLPQIETIWRLTRNMPPEKQALFAQLFSEIEHVNNHQDSPSPPAAPQLEFRFNQNQSNYYEPKWFYNSTNGHVQ